MPRSTREWARRKLQESFDNINWSGTHIHEVNLRYEKDHPEITDRLKDVLTILEIAQSAIMKVRGSF